MALVLTSLVFTGQSDVIVTELSTATPGRQASPTPPVDRSDCRPSARNFTHAYVPNPPQRTTLTTPDPGRFDGPLIVSGTVYAADETTPLPGVSLTVWQADASGQYRRDPLGARLQTNANGHHQFVTVKPGHFKVGCQLLPAHIHYRLRFLDYEPVFGSLFFADDPYQADLPTVEPAWIRRIGRRAGSNDPHLHTTFDIVLPVELGDFSVPSE